MKGTIQGNWIARNINNPPAPSTRAASSSSGGIDCNPASRISAANGVNTHVSIKMTESNAVSTCESHVWGGMPTLDNSQFSIPLCGCIIVFHINPATTGGIRSGKTRVLRRIG